MKSAWLSKTDTCIQPQEILQAFRTRFLQFENFDQQDAHEALMCIIDILESITKPFIQCTMTQETVCPAGKSTMSVDTTVVTVAPKGDIEQSLEYMTGWNTLENYEDCTGKVWNVAVTRTVFKNFPKILILSTTHKATLTVKEELANYILFASCVHIGSQMGGHYIAYTKHKGKWYLKDDLQCTETRFPETSGHCILFYRRK